jgi:hypothetical protein
MANGVGKGTVKATVSESLLSYIFNDFVEVKPFYDNADLVLGGMVLAHDTANYCRPAFRLAKARGRISGPSSLSLGLR